MEFSVAALHDGLERAGRFPKECPHNQGWEGSWLCGKALRMGLTQAFTQSPAQMLPNCAAMGKPVQDSAPYVLHL